MKYLSFIWRMWVYTNIFFWLLFLSPIVYISLFFSIFWFTNKVIWLWCQLIFYGAGLRYELQQNDIIDKNNTYIIISNHSSVMDIPLMYILHPNIPLTFIGKKEIESYPIIGAIAKKVIVYVDRKSKESREKVFPLIKQKIIQKRSPVIFPEGGVHEEINQKLAPFKDGAFSIAISCKIPILVYSFNNMSKIFPFDNFAGYPGKVNVKLLKIIETKNLTIKDKDMIKEEAYILIKNDLNAI